MEHINRMEQIENEQQQAEPKCDHCYRTEKLSRSDCAVLTALHQNETNQREYLRRKERFFIQFLLLSMILNEKLK